MNFFQAQQKAKKRTTYLIIVSIVGLFLFLYLINFFLLAFLNFFDSLDLLEDYTMRDIRYFLYHYDGYIYLFFLTIVVIGSLSQMFRLRRGGKGVVEDLGGRMIVRESATRQEKVLLNIVDEMSLASGIPPPSVYTLDDESINAFAAGFSTDDAIVCVTKGALENFTRQELQGVIAHEFSHIFNGDMNLYMKTSATVYGISAIATVGVWLLYINPRSNSKKSSIPVFVMVLGLILCILGYIGTFIGSLIKASISRQREFLADATAVKYTRDTSGIANALKKIYKIGSLIKSKNSSQYSHFYFAKGAKYIFFDKLLASHPPLKTRILRIEPNWDGKFNLETEKKSKQKKESPKIQKILTTAMLLSSLEKSGKLKEEDINNANEKIAHIPKNLIKMTQNPLTSQGLILAILSSDINEVPQNVINDFATENPKLFRQIRVALTSLPDLRKEDYLSTLLLSIPSLKMMSKAQYLRFKDTILSWIWANQKIVFFEWIVKRVIIMPLDAHFEIVKPFSIKYNKLSQIANESSYFLSFLSFYKAEDETGAKNLFLEATSKSEFKSFGFKSLKKLDFEEFEKSLDKLQLANANIKKQLIEGSIFIFSHNDNISIKDQQMLYAISLALKIPLPLI